jgi:hypothetical protein
VAITGTPLGGNVTWTENDPKIAATNQPPSPRQPSGLPVTNQIEDHLISAVWQSGNLWLSGNDACTPPGDTSPRSCLKLVNVVTAGSPSVIRDFDASADGIDLYFPAVTLDPSGDLFIAYSKSSSSMFPTAAALVGRASSPAALENEVIIAAGNGSYAFPPKNLWGDYSAAARDPADPTQVWVTAEYQASGLDATDWGTATAEVTMITRPATNQSPGASPGTRGGVSPSSPAPPSPR